MVWWAEGFNGKNGWAVGTEQDYSNPDEQDFRDAQSLYEQLEGGVIPLFYDRDAAGIPQGWVAMMKEAIISLAPQFSTRRMLKDYARELYVPAMREATGSVKSEN